MAIEIPVDVIDEAGPRIDRAGVLVARRCTNGRVRIVLANVEYTSPVAGTAKNLTEIMRHRGRVGDAGPVISEARSKGLAPANPSGDAAVDIVRGRP